MIDFVILLILALAILAGYYRGVIYSAVSLMLSLLSFLLALAFCPLVSGAIQKQDKLYEMMLYYFEGYEYINDTSVELVHVSVEQVSDEELALVITNADMPIPMGRAVEKNVKNRAYEEKGIYTLGDYFNQTIVDVVLNILSLLLLFLVFRLVSGFFLNLVDYGAQGLPVLKRLDAPIACGIGLLHGIFLVSVLFMLAPVGLTVVPQLVKFLESSLMGDFFYRGNILLKLVPTV